MRIVGLATTLTGPTPTMTTAHSRSEIELTLAGPPLDFWAEIKHLANLSFKKLSDQVNT